ncbi:kinase-like protein [Gloeophyllum trabeum ATCC 11539]|uniref:non-specific serine/threonine protein kinase n=1 Tax=Gloeophyllum trabeum (strain ATCC 11539 / FP-39264 / Madison 617) TaxID=670483 RepID=S7RSQ6_GLOTA|nr:kinase-like protein [Gloeophyllum trabeum ATCC 11539]EPQ57710.1 kinase-like protein [Gloeophyllum trabeum ATCC 11539]
MFRWARRLSTMLPPRAPSLRGRPLLEATKKVEEENFPWYDENAYYPVRIGQVFESRYQVLTKLGYGTSATVWLARDSVENKYVAIKVCTSNYPSVPREKAAFQRLRSIRESSVVQKCWDNFVVRSTEGTVHECFVLQPLCPNLAHFGEHIAHRWEDLTSFRATARSIFQALKFLHTEAHLIHCDLRQENFLLSTTTDAVFRAMEEHEASEPSPWKVDGDRVVHTTPYAMIPDDVSGIVLTDFGEARPGDTSMAYYDDIQPFPYRAPEIIFSIPFSYSVDIWNAAVMLWHMFEREPLFHPYTSKGEEVDLFHLRQMVHVIGLPPSSLLERSADRDFIHQHYFDRNGQWIAIIPLDSTITLEVREQRLEGNEKAEFLRFMRRCLQWEPEKRATAAELCDDPWLNPE